MMGEKFLAMLAESVAIKSEATVSCLSVCLSNRYKFKKFKKKKI